MRSRALPSVVVTLVVLVACLELPPLASGGHGSAFVVPGTLNVTANFGGWSWSGSGGPCERGSSGTDVAHFFGNATGGVRPYTYLWSFGDGSNNSTGQNVTHVFALNPERWIVTLTVADSRGAEGQSAVTVYPAVTSCPAEPAAPANGLETLLSLALVGAGVGAALALAAIWLRRRARR